ncbi:MAG: hypothetical protein CL708_06390 [Chloroflexi bacterium]|jgi:hypothetical protein|nr:hypothetical protein [Chloroflexota bacterium]|tara:strand:+ start:25758 stop:26597 length:840 start_codon:yes stop_codon:yes gene_type:complete
METIKNIITDNDKRGISMLLPHVSDTVCEDAANIILNNPNKAIILTGFYILSAGAAETDGPIGAIAIGNALKKIGYQVTYITDEFSQPPIKKVLSADDNLEIFPMQNHEQSAITADKMISDLNPSLIISIERCGPTVDGDYLNSRGKKIEEFNSKTEYLLNNNIPSIGIGDGGNEIGMGNLKHIIKNSTELSNPPCITTTDLLIPASTSNWGGYGLVAGLSKITNKNLLPSIPEDEKLIKDFVDAGGVDGITATSSYKVDSFELEVNSSILNRLHKLIQ